MTSTAVESVFEQLNSHNFSRRSIHESTKEFQHLQLLFSDLMQHKQGNSTIIVGPPASGKTTMITAAIQSALSKNKDLQPPKIIKLSGLLLKDLRSSIVALADELKLETDLEELFEDGNNFEDKLADVLQILRTCLATQFKSTPLVIVLDRFHLFAEHRPQALLYNLLDIVQQKESPLLVIGITCRVDILELLEKRVKSRFSHRSLSVSCPSFPCYVSFAKNLLTLTTNSGGSSVWNASASSFFSIASVQTGLRRLYNLDKGVGTLVNFLTTLLISTSEDGLDGEIFRKKLDEYLASSTLVQILDLTETEMHIILAIYRLTKGGNAAFNLVGLEETLRKAGAPIAMNATGKEELGLAFQSLVKRELLTAVDGKGDGSDKFYKCEIRGDEFMEMFKTYPNLPTVFQSMA